MTMATMDGHNAVPLPPGNGIEINFDPSTIPESCQQPQAQQVAVFEAVPNEEGGSILDVNEQFVVYAVKNGLIRILHRHSTLRSLLRDHEGQVVTDIAFFQSGDVLGTVSANRLFVWRIFERANEIVSEKLLEVSFSSSTTPGSAPHMSRMIWHPFNPNQFWLIHRRAANEGIKVATLMETTRIHTVTHPPETHAVCEILSGDRLVEDALQIVTDSDLLDLQWSGKDTRHVVSSHQDGTIRFWDLKETPKPPVCKAIIQQEDGEPVTRILFLPYEQVIQGGDDVEDTMSAVFLTASKNNARLNLWEPFLKSGRPPKKVQTLTLTGGSSYNVGICYGPMSSTSGDPPACFVLLSDRANGLVHAVAFKSVWSNTQPVQPLAKGFDYMVPFRTKFPTYSWSIICSRAESLDENTSATTGTINFDVRFHALQSKMVQEMTLPHYMLFPPTSLWETNTRGVTVTGNVADVTEVYEVEEYDEEEYDVDDDNEDDDDDDEYEPASAASALPVLDMGNSNSTNRTVGGNPFANWLGNLVAKNSAPAPPVESTPRLLSMPPPVPPSTPATGAMPTTLGPPPGLLGIPNMEAAVAEPAPAVLKTERLLNPMDLLSASDQSNGGKGKDKSKNNKAKSPKKQRGNSPKPKKNRSKAGGAPGAGYGKISILKRAEPDTPVAPAPAPATVEAPAAGTTESANGGVSQAALGETLKRVLGPHFQKQEKLIVTEVQRCVRTEIQTHVLPELSKTITQTMDQSVVKPLAASMEKTLKKSVDIQTDAVAAAVIKSIDGPLKEAFAENMKSLFIPAYEAATREMFSQISNSVDKHEATSANVDGLNAKIDSLTKAVEMLTLQVQSLQSTSISPLPGLPPLMDSMHQVQGDILALLQVQRYEAAFTKALSAPTTEMVIYCCKNTSPRNVLEGATSTLSQPILVCLMQQLGIALLSCSDDDLQTVLAWLQEISLSLDLSDQSIQEHVSGVLHNLVANINTRMAREDTPLRRPLQMLLHVIRGMEC